MPVVNITGSTAAAPTSALPIKCACDDLQHRCDDPLKDYCTTNYTCFTAMVRDDDGEDILTMGCIGQLERAELNCHVGSKSFVAIKCCNRGDFCNRNLLPRYTNDGDSFSSHASNAVAVGGVTSDPTVQQTLYVLIGLVLVLVVVILVAWRIFYIRHQRKMASLNAKEQQMIACNNRDAGHDIDLQVTPMGDSTLKGIYEQSCTSGSGSGVPLLAQRTVAHSIHLCEIIGKGRYGQVWRGDYHGENIAVKIFCSHAESAWWRECAIYSTVMLRHENILAFVAADTVSRTSSSTQLWLVTRYHAYGSLYDYLSRNTVTGVVDLLKLLVSAAAGLSHLHAEIIGTQGKPAIAHRDIKSKNILVMSDRRCCIADFGLAILQRAPHQGVSIQSNDNCQNDDLRLAAANTKVGTKRYMSPEVLDETINVGSFDSYRMADVYSFGLVIWETARRCLIGGVCEDYQVPYYDHVSTDPSFEDMYRIVCASELRPSMPNRWSSDLTMQTIARLAKDCWHAKPHARLPMLRVKKNLSKLMKSCDTQPAKA